MTDTFAYSARPARAAIAWATRDGLFVEIPCKDGPPYICRYHKTTEGLAAALNILLENAEVETRQIARTHPKITRAKPSTFTDNQRAAVAEVLKKLGLK